MGKLTKNVAGLNLRLCQDKFSRSATIAATAIDKNEKDIVEYKNNYLGEDFTDREREKLINLIFRKLLGCSTICW